MCVATGDVNLAQKIALEAFEKEALATANRSRGPAWHQDEPHPSVEPAPLHEGLSDEAYREMTADPLMLMLPVLVLGGAVLANALVLPENSQARHRRVQAEEKSAALLRSWLSAEQAEQWRRNGYFDVIGSDTGTRFRLSPGREMNVCQLDTNGKPLARWCFAPEGRLAVGDVLLAQKIALENAETNALAVANRRFIALNPRGPPRLPP